VQAGGVLDLTGEPRGRALDVGQRDTRNRGDSALVHLVSLLRPPAIEHPGDGSGDARLPRGGKAV
jgi:hypothetical protein